MDEDYYGFTLVELAIALMIIGLLIAGVLKGDELIENSRSTQFVRDLTAYNTAVNTFSLTYSALPGDMKVPSTRIPNCTTVPCSTPGDGNKRINSAPYGIPDIYTMDSGGCAMNESRGFWVHLAKAGLISGQISPDYSGSFSGQVGIEIPASADKDVGVCVLYYQESTDWGNPAIPGNYYLLVPANLSTGLLGSRAYFIDQKTDDGRPGSGNVRAAAQWGGKTPPTNCVTGSEYNVTSKNLGCNLLSLFD